MQPNTSSRSSAFVLNNLARRGLIDAPKRSAPSAAGVIEVRQDLRLRGRGQTFIERLQPEIQMVRNDRIEADPDQWRALMRLPDADLMNAWHQAVQACEFARRQGADAHAALLWKRLIEGAAASRFGVGQHLDRYRAAYGDP